jgi:hypothetical protein
MSNTTTTTATTADQLEQQLPSAAGAWLADARQLPLAEVFPAVARAVGRSQLQPRSAGAEPAAPGEAGLAGWSVDQAVRALLLVEARPAEVLDIYRYGDAAEKHAVLRALGVAEISAQLGDTAVPIVADAIRTNDQRLLAAALGPYATKWLPAASFRQAVLKCVFAGVPLAVVDGLPSRVDDELVRMMKDFAAERIAAGREVPADLQPHLTALRGV